MNGIVQSYITWSEPLKSPVDMYDCLARDKPNEVHLNEFFLLTSCKISNWSPFNSKTLMHPVDLAFPPMAANLAVPGIHFVSNIEKFSL